MGYYGQLCLSRSASHQAVCAAYRRRALQTHPDKGGSHDAYILVREAFEVLSDPSQRAEYDAALRASGGQDGLLSSGPAAVPSSGPPSSRGQEASRSAASGPLALAADTPRREAARTIVSMMDLPESAWAAVVEQQGVEVLEACRQQLQKSREGPNTRGKAAKESVEGDTGNRGPAVRGLYETKRGHWEVSLSIRRVQFAVFNIADIDKAHDWHVALVELRRKVEDNSKSGMPERRAFREAVDDAYEADPELRIVLSFRVNIREGQKVINGPFTHRLETALQLRNRVQQLRDMHAENSDVEREIRDAKLYEKKQRDLQKARQAAMLQEVMGALESLRREAAAQAKRRQQQQQQQPVLALPASSEASEAQPPLESQCEAPAEPQAEPEAEQEEAEPQADVWSVPLKGYLKFCRSLGLTKPQKLQLLRQVQEDHAVQNAISEAIARHVVNIRSNKRCLKDAQPSASSQLVPASASQPTGDTSLAMVVAEPPAKRQALVIRNRLRARAENGPGDTRRKWLLEVLLEKHEAVYYPGMLTHCELLRVALTSQRVWHASAGAIKRQFTNFRLADFGLVTTRSKRGRALPGGQLRMLKECLRTRRFALHVQHLDLSTLEMAPISNEEFKYMLGCLPNLVSIVLPSKGWAGNLQLKNFVNIAKALKVSIGAAAEADVILRNVTGSKPPEARAASAIVTAPAGPSGAAADSRFMLHLRSGRKRPRQGHAEADGEDSDRALKQAQADSDSLGFRASADELRKAIGQPPHHPHHFAQASTQPLKRARGRSSRSAAQADPLALPWQAPAPPPYSAPSLGQPKLPHGDLGAPTPAAAPVEVPPTPEPEALGPVPALQLLKQGSQLLRRRKDDERRADAPALQRPQPLAPRERHSFWWLPARGPS
eukprot:TRINITY_DN2698_c0_g1_i1.p1 TRINITY_DN2698_c0_g1~~TRINITY_DN2698_c0_g1_i1.p1  ORF type:complete len:931 (-),score=215.89 TRINITY_DN2698_c0_g1_i1:95-2767(-)